MKVNIKAIRIWQATTGLSVNELLLKAKIPRGTWSALVQKKEAGPKTVGKLAAALGCGVDDIIVKGN